MADKGEQKQSVGHHGTGIQADQVFIIQADREHIESVAREVIRTELDTLTAKATETFTERTTELVDELIDRIGKENAFNSGRVEDPRFQFALRYAQQEYGKSGSAELRDELTSLLLRIGKEDSDDIARLYEEAIKTIPLLKRSLIDAIAVVCGTRYVTFGATTHEIFIEKFRNMVFPFLDGAAKSGYSFTHIEYAKAGAVSMGSFEPFDSFRNRYPGLFSQGFEESAIPSEISEATKKALFCPNLSNPNLMQVNVLNNDALEDRFKALDLPESERETIRSLFSAYTMSTQEIRELLAKKDERFEQLGKYFTDTNAKHLNLTSVGSIIGVVNIERVSGESIDLTSWLGD